jgi:hypothetical protein
MYTFVSARLRPIVTIFTLFVFLVSLGCKKDFSSRDIDTNVDIGIDATPVTIENAKHFFYEKRQSVSSRSDTLNFDSTSTIIRFLNQTVPLWESAEIINYKGNVPVLAVPIAQCMGGRDTRDVFWVFFNDEFGQIDSRLVSIIADENYPFSDTYLQNFSGKIIQLDWSGHITNSLFIENGTIKGSIRQKNQADFREEQMYCYDGTIELDLGGCYPVAGWIEICIVVGSESPGNPVNGGTGPARDDLGWENGNNSNNNPGGGGSGNNISDYFNPADFSGMSRKVAVEVNKIKSDYCLTQTSANLLEIISSTCNYSSDPKELFNALKENFHGGMASLPSCAKKVIIDDWFDLDNAGETLLLNDPDLFERLGSFIKDKGCSQEAKESAQSLVYLQSKGKFPAFDEEDYFFPLIYAHFVIECALVRKDHPNWDDLDVYLEATWNMLSFTVHTSLDICGLIPVGGEPCDLANGVIYTLEGNPTDAALSFAATLPVAGWAATGVKWAGMTVTFKGVIHNLNFNLINGVVDWGSREDLRKVLSITNPNNEAHHIIPWSKKDHPLAQSAGKGNFHMNHPGNGKELEKFRFDNPGGVHANHPQYNAKVEDLMNQLWNKLTTHYGGASNVPVNVSKNKLVELQQSIAAHINANPTVKINDLTLNGVPVPNVP